MSIDLGNFAGRKSRPSLYCMYNWTFYIHEKRNIVSRMQNCLSEIHHEFFQTKQCGAERSYQCENVDCYSTCTVRRFSLMGCGSSRRCPGSSWSSPPEGRTRSPQLHCGCQACTLGWDDLKTQTGSYLRLMYSSKRTFQRLLYSWLSSLRRTLH